MTVSEDTYVREYLIAADSINFMKNSVFLGLSDLNLEDGIEDINCEIEIIKEIKEYEITNFESAKELE
ncbi:MAG: hypothetical protein WBO46_17030, partial [Caldilineaceae bacterium]